MQLVPITLRGLCEQNWRQVNTAGDRKFRNCFVQSRNELNTTENTLVLSPILFTLSTRIRQDSLVLSVSAV